MEWLQWGGPIGHAASGDRDDVVHHCVPHRLEFTTKRLTGFVSPSHGIASHWPPHELILFLLCALLSSHSGMHTTPIMAIFIGLSFTTMGAIFLRYYCCNPDEVNG